MIKFAIKAGIAASAVYYVHGQGIWNNSEQAIESANKLKAVVSPYVNEIKSQIPVEFPQVPDTENVCQLAKEYWNLGVRATFAFLVRLPECSREYLAKGTDALLQNPEIKNFVNSFSTSESTTATAAK